MSDPLGILSHGTTADLEEWLTEIRRIASLSGDEALSATDTFLWSVQQWMAVRLGSERPGNADGGPGESADFLTTAPADGGMGVDPVPWAVRYFRERLDRLQQRTAQARALLPNGEGLLPWDADVLRREADALTTATEPDTRARSSASIDRAQKDARLVADLIDIACHESAIRRSGEQVIHSTSSVQSILTAVDRATMALEAKGGLTPTVLAQSRAAKERAARYRFEKKSAEAEVAAAGGNEKRAARLRAEAAAMLTQDWKRAFSGEAPPIP